MNKYTYWIGALILVVGIVWLIATPGKPGKYDGFAQCIKDAGNVTFYGAFWCPHCQAQKARFGKSAKYLPYVECSTPDGQGQTPFCAEKGVTTYPTWDFGSTSTSTIERLVGEMELVAIAQRTGCALPLEN